MGQNKFVGKDFEDLDYVHWIFQFSFCVNSMTIVSGSLSERTFLDAYVVYSLIMTGFIYPISAGWAWGGGWLESMHYHDFAGSGVVHLVGGVGGFCGAVNLG
mmetsp:Transcript_8387/g.7770  ORF Transcript_8387/g.7770 Transcript_8387/m.7770 type:complete len:102 (+) Transcript_8387:266-571(+)